ncbi:MAG TPA: response regulator transcription factor [Anaerolineales bacterium]|nr:response regulator transcription factor [Anaerolineales bacterium]
MLQVLGRKIYDYIPGLRRKIGLRLHPYFNPPPDALAGSSAYIDGMNDIRVLIVDDVEEVRQDLSTLLSLAGDIEIVGEASNGLEAIQLVETLCPRVVLMDLEMPVMDGYAAACQIKTILPTCRVIALTLHGDKAERQRATQSGIDEFIVKGAPLETLMEAIRSAPTFGQIPKGEKNEH